MLLQFGEWLPDLADFGNPGSLSALNVIPSQSGYRPFKSLSAQSNALTDRCQGAFAARDADANIFFYAGDKTNLYEEVDNVFTDESGATYATDAGDAWEFAQYDTKIIATNFANPVQTMTIGGGAGGGAFADLITSTLKPKMKHVATIRDFLVGGNTNDGTDGHVPNRVWWSGFNDTTDFDPDATTQCDFQDIRDGGWVQRIVGGVEYGVIFQERQISRMTYVGTPLVFDIFAADRKRGTPIPNSVVGHGRFVFYISEEGFFGFDGAQSHPIGSEKVDRTFWAQFDITNKARVFSAIDLVNKLVCWAFPGSGSVGGSPNKIYMHHWPSGKWAEAEVDTEIIVQAATQGYTLDGLDAISTDIDGGFTESLDSDVWKGGAERFAAFDTAHKLGYFTGSNLAATIDTNEVQPIKGKRSIITATRPLIDGGTPTVRLGNRNRLTDTVSFSSTVTINAIGECPVRVNARYFRGRLEIPAGETWSHAQGIEIPDEHVKPAGSR